MKRIIALLLVCVGMALPYLKSVEVLPTRADWSGWTPRAEPNNWVGNTFTANFDSICYCEVFVGYLGPNPSTPYEVDVNEYPGGELVAHNDGVAADRDHSWVKFPLTTGISGTQYLIHLP
jgi:hypothetical protein